MTTVEYSCSSMVNYVLGFEEMLNVLKWEVRNNKQHICII